MREPDLTRWLPDEEATRLAAEAIARLMPAGREELLLTLAGELGAGKTTLARAVLRSLGVTGSVKSPTYTLVEPYEARGRRLLHLDLYRLGGGEELELLGYRDLRQGSLLTLVEWPDRASGALGSADLAAQLAYRDGGRDLTLRADSPAGDAWLAALRREWSRVPSVANSVK